jgi:hypothetical protein
MPRLARADCAHAHAVEGQGVRGPCPVGRILSHPMELVSMPTCEGEPGPFAAVAEDYSRRGLSVIPTGGEDGKRPLVRGFMRFAQYPPGATTVRRWLDRFGDANIGMLAGPVSRVTVVDLDEPGRLNDAIRTFGDTPLIDESPRGGNRLYYRHAGEMTLNRLNGGAIDVRAGGGCPLLVLPPSRRDGRQYRFVQGTPDDLPRLPCAKPGSLPTADRELRARRIAKGCRNDWLFRACLKAARHCDDMDALLDVARTRNEECDPTLSDADVVRVVASAWRYEAEGRNWSGIPAHVVTTKADLLAYSDAPEARWLLDFLRANQEGVRDRFAISPRGLGTAIGWNPKRVAAARDVLVARGAVVQVHVGGNGTGDPHLYRFP